MSSKNITSEIKRYAPARAISLIVHGAVFRWTRILFLSIGVISFGFVAYGVGALYVANGYVTFHAIIEANSIWIGNIMLATALLLFTRAGNFYFNSLYFNGMKSVVSPTKKQGGITYEIADICLRNGDDLTASLFSSDLGSLLLLRLGIPFAVIQRYLVGERSLLSSESIILMDTHLYTLADLIAHIKATDISFSNFLEHQGITDDIFEGASHWTYSEYMRYKAQQQWWSRDSLSTTRGIGNEFVYGIPYVLLQYTKSIYSGSVFSSIANNGTYGTQYVEQIEATLARTKEANVLLVGEDGVGKLDILIEVGQRMDAGVSMGSIVGKHLMVLDTEMLLMAQDNKTSLEQILVLLLAEASHAGNIVLVINKLHKFIQSAHAMGIDVVGILDPYLNAPELHIVATVDRATYHHEIETKGGLLRRFETIQIEPPDVEATVRLLLSLVNRYEWESNIRFTYRAVYKIAEGADRYIVNGVMPDKAVHLIDEISADARRKHVHIIDSDYVDVYLSDKTGIPVGPLAQKDRDVLLHLEDVLHKHIVGQERAVASMSGVMRRSRSGIQDESKPMGSFLFLGPTGVGKTESAKALAEIFFRSEDSMNRIDMTEYSNEDSLERLIGGNGVAGVLPNMIKEHPYSVLLLDEFGKASVAVHDLFLQILDEGVFTDGFGKKINARNTIIVATSNAGSDKILAWVEQGETLRDKHDEFLSYLIAEHVYKAELLNRFDEVILFDPLREDQQASIARKMLSQLKERIQEKGYQLEVTDDLVATLVRIGYKPEFGARAMQRAIQNVVEEAVAEKIIAGSIQKGDNICFTEEDLAGFELSVV